MSTADTEHAAPPSLLNGFFILLIVVAAVVGWIAIGASIHLSSFYASFLFIWYWSTVEKLDFKKFVPSMIGAMLGIACAWGLHALPAVMGTNHSLDPDRSCGSLSGDRGPTAFRLQSGAHALPHSRRCTGAA